MVQWCSPQKNALFNAYIASTGVMKVVDEAMAGLYTSIVQPSRAMRNAVMNALLKPFESGSCLHSQGAAQADLGCASRLNRF